MRPVVSISTTPNRDPSMAAKPGSLGEIPCDRPSLGRVEEAHLARRIKIGDMDALYRLVEANLGFVGFVAAEYRTFGVPHEDLMGEGTVGLIEAAQRFDPGKEVRFISYAVWWIRKRILLAVSRRSQICHVSEYWSRARRRRTGINRHATASPSPGISAALSGGQGLLLRGRLRRSDHGHELPHSVATVSLDTPVDQDKRPLSEKLDDPAAVNAEELAIRRDLGERLPGAISTLTSVEKQILAHRYGLGGSSALSYKQIGKEMGLSHERIRQLEALALRNLRGRLERGGSGPGSRGTGPSARAIP